MDSNMDQIMPLKRKRPTISYFAEDDNILDLNDDEPTIDSPEEPIDIEDALDSTYGSRRVTLSPTPLSYLPLIH